jgi:VWFA-related protein
VTLSIATAQRNPTPDEPVAIDFFAIGNEGPVFDLRAEEVTIKIDGRARKVRSLRYIPLPMSDPAAPESAPDLEPAFGTNQVEANGRWVTIVVDHDSIRPGTERDSISAVIRMIRQLGPRDRVSYVTMPHGGLEVDFTEKHDQVIEALRRFRATAPREPTEQERSCRTRNLLNSMSHYIEGLERLEGPKLIVLVSTGMLNPRRDAPMLGPPGPCEIRMIYFQEVSRASSRARASTFVVQPDDVSMDPARQVFVDPTASRFAAADEDRAGLESLAGVTGGEFMRIIGPEDNTLLNHVRASAGYYIATVDPDAGERNGAPHRVEVSVARDKVRVRTRP